MWRQGHDRSYSRRTLALHILMTHETDTLALCTHQTGQLLSISAISLASWLRGCILLGSCLFQAFLDPARWPLSQRSLNLARASKLTCLLADWRQSYSSSIFSTGCYYDSLTLLYTDGWITPLIYSVALCARVHHAPTRPYSPPSAAMCYWTSLLLFYFFLLYTSYVIGIRSSS